MRQWKRALARLHCGGCRAVIAQDAVFLAVSIQQTQRARCPACAKRLFGEEPSADVPQIVRRPPERLNPFTLPKQLVEDFKSKQAGK